MEQIINYITGLPTYFYTSLGIMAFIAMVAIIAGHRVSKLDVREKPNRLMTMFIVSVDGFNNFIKSYIGKHWRFMAPITLVLAIYVFLANISGLFTLDTPTRYTSITFSLSIMAFFLIQSMGFISMNWRHLLSIFKPLAPMMPLNIISDLTPIISMALRLFGNIISGSVILYLIYSVGGWFSLLIAPALHLVFDIGFGLIQALVFVLLTVIFASTKISEEDFVE
jgi:F-type H+-transporting ATPase subunit a